MSRSKQSLLVCVWGAGGALRATPACFVQVRLNKRLQRRKTRGTKKKESVPSAACWRGWRLNEAEGFPSASLVMKLFVYVHLLHGKDSALQQESLVSLLSKHTWEGCCHYLHSVGGQLAENAIKTGTESITRAAGSLLCECKFNFQRENWTIAASGKSRLRFHLTRKRMWRLSLRGTFFFGGGSEYFITSGMGDTAFDCYVPKTDESDERESAQSLSSSHFPSSQEYSHQILWASVPPQQRENVWKCRYVTSRSSPSYRPHLTLLRR